jgi:tetratricopeptide (TPR) repeat protein
MAINKQIAIRNLILLSFLLISINNYSQKTSSGIDVCIALKGFNSSSEAESALDRIIASVGISKNFVVQECPNVSNAAALQVQGVRYIFYNQKWMSSINNTSYDGLFILAHEVGHHVNGHALDWVLLASKTVNPKTLSEGRAQELQADEFAGFVMAKLGASLNEASDAINNITNDNDDTYSTHPSRSKRLLAIKKGYANGIKNGSNNENNKVDSNYVNSDILIFDDGSRWEGPIHKEETTRKGTKDGVYGTITSITKSPEGKGIMYNIDGSVYKGSYYNKRKSGYGEMYNANGEIYKGQWLDGNKSGRGQLIKKNGVIVTLINGESENKIEAEKYFDSGEAKAIAEDNNGAIADFTKVITLDSDDFLVSLAYLNRADVKNDLNDFKGALLDLNKSISLNSDYFRSYYSRGFTKVDLEDYKGAIIDFTKAIELYKVEDSNKEDIEFKAKMNGTRGHAKENLDDYKGAIEDFNTAIELDRTQEIYYHSRGDCKYNLEDYNGAIEDYSNAIEINPNNSEYYFWRGKCKKILEDYEGAILNFDEAIRLNSEDADYYSLRGDAKYDSDDNSGALLDYSIAIQLNPKHGHAYRLRGLIKYYNKDYNAALLDLNSAVNVDNNDVDALYDLSQVKDKLNDKTGALQSYDKIIKLFITNSYPPEFMAKIYNSKSYLLVGLKRYVEALPLVEKALKFDSSKWYIWDTRGEIMYNLGKYQEAIKDMSKAIEIDDKDGHPFYFRGLAKFKLGMKSAGCDDLNKASELGDLEANNRIKENCN